jgi:hypothetical protein
LNFADDRRDVFSEAINDSTQGLSERNLSGATHSQGGLSMVVKIDKHGNRIHSPPYTKAEEAEFYRRVGGGPVTVVRPADDRKAPTSQGPQQPSPTKPRRS